MDDYKKSNYAINKVRKGIVYRNNDGSILEVTFEKIAEENPNFTVEDFEKLKELSDELYHEEDKSDWIYHHYVKESLESDPNNKLFSASALEDKLISAEADKQFRMKLQQVMDTVLTLTEKRRFLKYVVESMTLSEIAKIENCSIRAVWGSIKEARRKIAGKM